MDALNRFVNHLHELDSERLVGSVRLFGSAARGEAGPESDLDVLVLARDHLDRVSQMAAEAAWRASATTGVSVEPLVYCLDAARHPVSMFLHRALAEGREVYAVSDEELRESEARGYLNLARDYLAAARRAREAGDLRLAADGAYNAAELCAKGFLLFKLDALPKTHGGIAAKLGEIYVLTGELDGAVGRALHQALETRNKSRYDWHAEVTATAVDGVLNVAAQLADALEHRLAGGKSG